jgi:hypothetical protein
MTIEEKAGLLVRSYHQSYPLWKNVKDYQLDITGIFSLQA